MTENKIKSFNNMINRDLTLYYGRGYRHDSERLNTNQAGVFIVAQMNSRVKKLCLECVTSRQSKRVLGMTLAKVKEQGLKTKGTRWDSAYKSKETRWDVDCMHLQ